MTRSLARILDHPSTVSAAAVISLALGLFFTFVWAPHPWGWQGIDQYHDLASRLARGEPFATTDVPWGYAYFAAAFYRLFGERIWVPVTAQVVINCTAPILLYRLVRPMTSQRVAALGSLLTGALCFNNVYASTQASDALCTILFLASLLALSRAIATGRWWLFALSGLLSGIVPQFRPNLVLLPALFAAGYVLYHRTARSAAQMAVFSVMVVAALSPWIVRNYRLTGLFLPTSTHGGVQLWYGSLQVGPYLERRAHNPRSIFESPPFPYTSLTIRPIVIDVHTHHCAPFDGLAVVYWTDRDPTRRTLTAAGVRGRVHHFLVPAQPAPTALYYYAHAKRREGSAALAVTEPARGAEYPHVYLIDVEHLRDIDRHDDFLDVFDVVALARHLAWREPLPNRRLDLTNDGAVSRGDLDRAIALLLPDLTPPAQVVGFAVQPDRVIVELNDHSTLAIPAAWSGLHTDLDVAGNLAGALISRSRTFSSLPTSDGPANPCPLAELVRVDDRFYRREPHLMRRYMALALDNIRRDPWAFAAASAYRMIRLFIIRGTADVATAQQFSASRFAYAAGTVLSAAFFLTFLAGAWIAWRRRSTLLWLLVPIAYVPLTICFVLTNMRYTVTMQPLIFVFVAVAVVTVLRWESAADVEPGP